MTKKPDIQNLRNRIDTIDQEILNLLHKRLDIVKSVKELKNTNNLNIYSPKREESIIQNMLKMNKNYIPEKSLIKIYSEMFSISRKLQKYLKIGYLGPESTFSHIAAENIFGTQSEYIPLISFSDIFTELETGQIDYGVVPIENSNEGIVGYTLDLLIEYNHYII
ncbi:MAG: chorismate mutase, partial [Spirochaetes bacterium]|nr:chorismate mutase [Spirochaetota bacterium]